MDGVIAESAYSNSKLSGIRAKSDHEDTPVTKNYDRAKANNGAMSWLSAAFSAAT